ncbi:MAG: DMT family transporter [Pikeienuella sp.]
MYNSLLYVATVFIWGASWIGITYQVGEVLPVHGVLYRYTLAAVILLAFVTARRAHVLTRSQHVTAAAMGGLMFGVNYVMVYTAIGMGLTTGLAAVIFSLLIVMNAINNAIFYREVPTLGLAFAALLGLAGIVTLFADEMTHLSLVAATPLLLCVLAVYCASLGNMCSRRLQGEGVAVTTSNAWAMAYAAIGLLIYSAMSTQPFTISWGAEWWASLAVLIVFSTIIAFWAYLTLLGRIGAARAAYAFVAFPAVALVISSVWEAFEWTPARMAGAGLILAGNLALLVGQTRRGDKTP